MSSKLMNMELLVDTVQQLSLASDLESIMRIVRTVARKITGADGATFVLKDGPYCYYADEDAISPLWKGSRFPLETCISGWSMLNRQPAVIADIYADSRIPADAYRPTFVKSLAMVPIRKMKPIGAIGNYWAEQRMPTEEEVAMLQALADITAVSIENVYVRNTLEERVAERTRELADALEREKDYNELKSTFLSMASHELRTPLSTILSSSWLVTQYTEAHQQEERNKHLGRIDSSVHNLLGILDEFLSADKLEKGKVKTETEETRLEAFLAETAESIEGLLKPGQHLRLNIEKSITIATDRKILHNLLLNLLSNAIKYSEKDVILRAETGADDEIFITVQDQGIGIPEVEQQRIFNKYFRATNSSGIQGVGLGLNIVKHYADLLGGEISFESREGEGTSFTVKLPRSLEERYQSTEQLLRRAV